MKKCVSDGPKGKSCRAPWLIGPPRSRAGPASAENLVRPAAEGRTARILTWDIVDLPTVSAVTITDQLGVSGGHALQDSGL